MTNDDGQDLGSSFSLGATFLTGSVMSSLWDASDGGTAVLAAAKKKAPAKKPKAPAKKPAKKSPKPKPTKGPGCVTQRTQPSCTQPC